MKKKSILNSIKIIVLGLVFCFGISAIAATINPLNVGPAQDKAGSINITAGGFRSFGTALFDDNVTAGAVDNGTTKLIVNGSANFSSKVKIDGLMKVSSLSGNAGKNICADSSGKLIICPSINGECGPANMTPHSIAPSGNSYLCSFGNPSTVTGNGPWNWTCNGILGGTTAPCSAPVYCISGSQTFTSPGSFPIPQGCSTINIEARGGGGGGGGGAVGECFGGGQGGGGGGGSSGKTVSTTLYSPQSNIIEFPYIGSHGSGGAGGYTTGNKEGKYGVAGTETIVKLDGNIILYADSGLGGYPGLTNGTAGIGGSGGDCSGSTAGPISNGYGGNGGTGGTCNGFAGGLGGAGGHNSIGVGGNSASGLGAGGGGGGGGECDGLSPHNGGKGGSGNSGYVKITWQ